MHAREEGSVSERMGESTDERLVRIETKLDAALAKNDDHEQRIRKLEQGRWPLPSMAVLVSMAALGMEVFRGLS